ncbi:hypothetical protein [Allofranklinella schreckenbergeri]|uniref:hypothetical protein n=1 Tax=Allofranklinella schreckenbergeri TaxID=1076744 RepID=UPI001EEF235A|nr:hypothetical protein [Allofranklinella schreckenbergeri]
MTASRCAFEQGPKRSAGGVVEGDGGGHQGVLLVADDAAGGVEAEPIDHGGGGHFKSNAPL